MNVSNLLNVRESKLKNQGTNCNFSLAHQHCTIHQCRHPTNSVISRYIHKWVNHSVFYDNMEGRLITIYSLHQGAAVLFCLWTKNGQWWRIDYQCLHLRQFNSWTDGHLNSFIVAKMNIDTVVKWNSSVVQYYS